MNLTFLPEDKADAYAIQALAKGEATPDQQKRAFKCIVQEIARTYEMTFNPESERVSNFNEGSRHVGRAIVGIVNANLTALYAELERKPMAKEQNLTVTRKRK